MIWFYQLRLKINVSNPFLSLFYFEIIWQDTENGLQPLQQAPFWYFDSKTTIGFNCTILFECFFFNEKLVISIDITSKFQKMLYYYPCCVCASRKKLCNCLFSFFCSPFLCHCFFWMDCQKFFTNFQWFVTWEAWPISDLFD